MDATEKQMLDTYNAISVKDTGDSASADAPSPAEQPLGGARHGSGAHGLQTLRLLDSRVQNLERKTVSKSPIEGWIERMGEMISASQTAQNDRLASSIGNLNDHLQNHRKNLDRNNNMVVSIQRDDDDMHETMNTHDETAIQMRGELAETNGILKAHIADSMDKIQQLESVQKDRCATVTGQTTDASPTLTSAPDGRAEGNRFQRMQRINTSMRSLEDEFECFEQLTMSQISDLEDKTDEARIVC